MAIRILRSIGGLAALETPAVLALGVFDGVHAGHQVVLGEARTLAEQTNATALPLTFDPHPCEVLLGTDRAPRLLTNLPHKCLIFERLGFEAAIVLPFTREFASQPPDDFLAALAAAARPLRGIVTGTDFCFGRNREGSSAFLAARAAHYGYRHIAVPPVLADGERISSTQIRQAVAAGNFGLAPHWLGREYTVYGRVIEGRRLGRTIGFPTANVETDREQLPPDGVYAVEAWHGTRHHTGVANLGLRPTVESAPARRLLEVHLFDFDADLYGGFLEVRFVRRLRDEQRFSSLDDLRAAINRDAAAARKIFSLAQTHNPCDGINPPG